MDSSVDLSIIMINWRSVAFTRTCLRSIFANAGEVEIEVIVVDNASGDGCGEMVSEEFPQVTFIQSAENLGFARANNLAFSCSRGRAVLFLNPDTEIQDHSLQLMMRTLETVPGAAMVGARLLNSDSTLQTSCVTAFPSILNEALSSDYLRNAFPRWNIWGMKPLFLKSNSPAVVDAISGACMMVKRDAFVNVGGFSTDYFMYAEDMDLCFRFMKASYRVYYIPGAVVVHHGGKSSGLREDDFSDVLKRDSLARFMTRHRGRAYARMFRFSTAIAATCRLLLLAMFSLFAVNGKARQFLARAFRRWSAVLAWSLGLTPQLQTQAGPISSPDSKPLSF